ncbi:MerR family transcriptional regulator [Gorillibacterium sp. sgz5001074]|uniref:MerR family transcriptional regulator n=1 Tax=Gorillibacterium sp. sgz5001074 TaxID=3446695 RepID=UPI003F67C671
MKIGELSRLTGASIRSLRYYEEKGLITPYRMENGYREYSPFTVEQVNTIRFYLELGLSTDEIAGFLHCVLTRQEAFCREIVPVYRKKLAELEGQISLLTRIKSNLEDRIRYIAEQNPQLLEE